MIAKVAYFIGNEGFEWVFKYLLNEISSHMLSVSINVQHIFIDVSTGVKSVVVVR